LSTSPAEPPQAQRRNKIKTALISGNKPDARIGKRSATYWKKEIKRKIEPEHWPKICAIIFWRLHDNPNSKFRADNWFKKEMTLYDYGLEYSNAKLQALLDRLGITIEYGRIETGVNSNKSYSAINRRCKLAREAKK
jgi:hypothetical protein